MKHIVLIFLLLCPTIGFAQHFSDEDKVADGIDAKKMNDVIGKPFNNSIISNATVYDSEFFFYELMAKNQITLESSLYIRGPHASSVWTIKSNTMEIDVFIDRSTRRVVAFVA